MNKQPVLETEITECVSNLWDSLDIKLINHVLLHIHRKGQKDQDAGNIYESLSINKELLDIPYS